MWIVRIILLAMLFGGVAAFGYVLARRKKSEGVLENRPINLLGVIVYNLACYLLAGLPSDQAVFAAPEFLTHTGTRTGFLLAGLALIILGVVLFTASVRQRKTVGGENVKEGLLTGGVYRIARHPIYAGIVMVSLGLGARIRHVGRPADDPADLAGERGGGVDRGNLRHRRALPGGIRRVPQADGDVRAGQPVGRIARFVGGSGLRGFDINLSTKDTKVDRKSTKHGNEMRIPIFQVSFADLKEAA